MKDSALWSNQVRNVYSVQEVINDTRSAHVSAVLQIFKVMTIIGRNGKKLRVPVGSDALSRKGGASPTIANTEPVL